MAEGQWKGNKLVGSVTLAHSLSSVLRGQRQMALYEFEANLVYIGSSGTARARQ